MKNNELLELLEYRNNKEFHKTIDLYQQFEVLDNYSLRKNLLIELLLHDCIYDNEDCLKEIINIFKKESFDYLLFYLFLYDKTKDEKYLSLFKNGILDKTYLLGLNSRNFYKSNDKAYKIYDKCLKITKDAKKEKLLIKSLKINHPLIHHQLGSFYFEKGDMEKAKLYYLKGYVYGYSPCCRALARYYHEIKDIDKEIHYLIELLRYDEKYKKTDEVLRVYEVILNNEKNLKELYPFLLYLIIDKDNNINNEVMHVLSNAFLEGKLLDKDELFAYFLYSCCDNEDIALDNLKNRLIDYYKELIDKELEPTYGTLLCIEEKRKKEIEELNKAYPNKKIVLDKNYLDYDDTNKKSDKSLLYKEALTKKENYEIVPLLIKAANIGHSKAMYALYELYKDDDKDKAIIWLDKADRANNPNVNKESIDYQIVLALRNNKEDILKLYNVLRYTYLPLIDSHNDYNKSKNPKIIDIRNSLRNQTVKEIIDSLTQNSLDGNDVSDILLARYYNSIFYLSDENKRLARYYFMRCNESGYLKYIYNNWQIDDFETHYYLGKQHILYDSKKIYEKYFKNNIDEDKLEFIKNEAKHSTFANEILSIIYYDKDKDLSFDYAAKADLKYLFKYVGNDGYVKKYTDKRYIDYLQANALKDNLAIIERLYKLYCDNELCKELNINYDMNIKKELEKYIENDKKEKRRIELELLEKDPEYIKQKKEKELKEKRIETELLNIGLERMKKYPCPLLSKWYEKGYDIAKKIIIKYGSLSEKEAYSDMIQRDQLLKLGFTLNEMHDQSGYFIGYQLAEKIAKKQIEQNKDKITNVVKKEVVEEPKYEEMIIDNNVKFVLFGKLNNDPYDKDHPSKVFHRFFSAAYYTDRARRNKDYQEASYGSMQNFYVEELCINGEKINSDDFYHHLSLTLQPGKYVVSMRVVINLFFPGTSISSYVLNLPDPGRYFPSERKKDILKTYRKRFVINDFIVQPGKTYYLAFFATIYGDYTYYFDRISGRYEYKHLQKINSSFSFEVMNRKQVDNKAHRYALEEKDFIPIDQIGELDYNPHVRLSN